MKRCMPFFKGWAVLTVVLLFLAPNALARNLYVANTDDDSVTVIDATPNQPHAIGRYQFIPETLRRSENVQGAKRVAKPLAFAGATH